MTASSVSFLTERDREDHLVHTGSCRLQIDPDPLPPHRFSITTFEPIISQ
jgi:hypothetical protein